MSSARRTITTSLILLIFAGLDPLSVTTFLVAGLGILTGVATWPHRTS